MTTQPPNKPKRRTYSAEFKELLGCVDNYRKRIIVAAK